MSLEKYNQNIWVFGLLVECLLSHDLPLLPCSKYSFSRARKKLNVRYIKLSVCFVWRPLSCLFLSCLSLKVKDFR